MSDRSHPTRESLKRGTALLPGTPRPLVVGHRGAPAALPENTLVSFEAALRAGADAVECDVRLTRDARVVAMHDATVDRTTEGRGSVASLDLAEIRSLRLRGASPSERVPTLEEILALCRGSGGILIEAKVAEPPGGEALVDAVLACVERAGAREYAALISFDPRAVARSAVRAPDLPRGPIFDERFDPARAVPSGSSLLVVEKSLLPLRGGPPPAVELFAYSLDEAAHFELARRVGLAGWISNDVPKAVAARGRP